MLDGFVCCCVQYVDNPNGGAFFTCQHGEEECKGNILHSCGIEHSTSTDQQVEYVNCLMGSPGAGELVRIPIPFFI